MAHLFISYSHEDKEYAHKLQKACKQRGLDAWIDDRIDYGSQWPEEIEMRLESCVALILIMTPQSKKSEWVQNELSRSKRKKKKIFPLLLEGDEPWLAVETIQYVDVRDGNLPPERFYETLPPSAKRIDTPPLKNVDVGYEHSTFPIDTFEEDVPPTSRIINKPKPNAITKRKLIVSDRDQKVEEIEEAINNLHKNFLVRKSINVGEFTVKMDLFVGTSGKDTTIKADYYRPNRHNFYNIDDNIIERELERMGWYKPHNHPETEPSPSGSLFPIDVPSWDYFKSRPPTLRREWRVPGEKSPVRSFNRDIANDLIDSNLVFGIEINNIKVKLR